MRWPFCVMAVSALALLSACGEEKASEPAKSDEYEAELFANTRLLSVAALDELDEVSPTGELRFRGVPEELEGVGERAVLLAPAHDNAPDGLLRFVLEVEEDDGDLVLRTALAPVWAAFKRLHVGFDRTIFDLGDAEGARIRGLEPLAVFDDAHFTDLEFSEYPVNGDDNKESPEDQVFAHGVIGGGFYYRFELDLDWGEVDDIPEKVLECLAESILGGGCSPQSFLPEIIVNFDVETRATASLTYEGVAFLPYERPYTLGEVDLPKFPVGPLVFHPSVEFTATTYGEATSKFKLGSSIEVGTAAGVRFSTESTPKVIGPDPELDFEALDVEAVLSAKTRLTAGPLLHLRLYGFTGPKAGLSGFAELRANRDESPCWELEAGAALDLGFDIVVKDMPVVGDLRLADWSESFDLGSSVIDSGECAALPNDGAPLPVAGTASEQAFADPDFTPWSRAFQGAVVSHPYESSGAQLEFSDVTPTIDGRFLITGSNTDALVKVDPNGELVWAKKFVPPEPILETVELDDLLPSRVVDAGDAGMLLVAHPYTLAKIEASGELDWAKRLDVPHEQDDLRFTAAAAAPNGGFYVVGTRGDDPNASNWQAWVLRTDAEATPLWSKTWATPETQTNLRAAIAYEGGVVAVGDVYDREQSAWHGLIVKFDDDGEVAWSKHLYAPDCSTDYYGSIHLTTLIESQDGDLVVAGTIGRAPDATLVFKLEPDGELAWEMRQITPAPHLGPVITDIVQLPTGGYLATGTFEYWQSGGGHSDVWLGGLDGIGRLLWMQRYGGQRDDTTTRYNDAYPSLVLTQDGGAVVAAFTDSLTPEGKGLWAFKVPAKDGSIDFDEASPAHTEVLTWETAADARHCLSLEDAEIEPEDETTTPEPIELRVEDAELEAFQQAP